MNLKNAVALITGGSAGIGRSIAQTLAASGARVAITGRDKGRLAEAAEGLGAFPIQADVSNEEWRLWPRVFDGWLSNVLYWELTRTRLPALLRYEDLLSMAFSIESRVPFLDHRLVELAFALPDEAKRQKGWSKYGLRRALEGLLPASVVWRRDKKGFPTPVGNWLRDERGAAALDLLRDPQRRTRYLLSQAALDGFIRDHVEGKADRSWQLWRAISTEIWMEAFALA